jgi:hypothetical protein
MDFLDRLGSIQRVTYYQAAPVHTCDRCSQGIKHVFRVTFRDGLVQEYGIECINRVLDNEPSMRSLFAKNSKLLQKRQRALRALSMPEDQMPRGSEYFESGLYFIADEKGEDVMGDTHWFFHPVYDVEKNHSGNRYVVCDDAAHLAECREQIEKGKVWLVKEIERLETFLAKVIRASHKNRPAGEPCATNTI